MAGQPPPGQHPGYVPDDLKPWYKSRAFLIPLGLSIPTAIVAAVVGLIVTVIQDRATAPPTTAPTTSSVAPTTSSAPTSDRAAVLVDWPCMPDDRQIHVSGSGWLGDTEVEINLPEQLHIVTHRALVSGGSFSDRPFEVRLEDWGPLDRFVVTVRGLQSRKQVVRELHTASGAGSCTLD